MLENIAQWSKLLVFFSLIVLSGLVFPAFIPVDTPACKWQSHEQSDTIPYPVSTQYESLDANKSVPHHILPVEKADYTFSDAYPTADCYKFQPNTDTLNGNRPKNVHVLTVLKTVHVCQGEGYFVANKPRFVSGVFRDTLNTVHGRDSIVVTNLSVIVCKYSE